MGLVDQLPYKKTRCLDLVRSTYFYGIFPYDLPRLDLRKYAWFSFSIFSLGYLCLFTITNLRLKTPFTAKIAMFKTSISSFMCLMVMLTTYAKRRDIVALIDDIEHGFYTYSDEFCFRYKFSVPSKVERRFISRWAAVIILSWGTAVFSPPIILLLKGEFEKNSRAMLLTWLPWKRDTLVKFCLGHFTLLVFTIPVVTTLAGSTRFILTIYFEFRDQFERLGYALSTAVELAEARKTALREFEIAPQSGDQVLKVDLRTNQEVNRKIIECITHYRVLVK